MALARAFTKKDRTGGAKTDISSPMPAAPSFLRPKPKHPGGGSIRNKISGPTALISSTNQLAYNAPDLFPKNGKSPLVITTTTPASPVDSAEIPDLSHSNTATPDSSTRGSTPTSESVEPNHLSGYFDGSKNAPIESHGPNRSRSGSKGMGVLRKKSDGRVRSPTISSNDGNMMRKPSLTSIQSGTASAPSWMSEGMRKTSNSTPRTTPPTTPMFTPLTGNTNATLGVKSSGAVANGLGRKNTVRARGSIDMFMPDNGVDAKPSYADLRSKTSRGNLQQPRQAAPPMSSPSDHAATRPSTSDRDRDRERRPTNPPAQPKTSDPFGKELAQVSELAEEYGIGRQVKKLDEEEREMQRRNLMKFSAEEYIAEFQYLFDHLYAAVKPPAAVGGAAVAMGGAMEGGARKQVWI